MIKELEKHASVLKEVSLEKYNTYHIGGKVKYLIEPNSINDLVDVIKLLDENKVDYFVLGNGSNVVLSSKYYDGAVIKLSNLNGIAIKPELNMAYAEAGAMMPSLVMDSVNKGLTGLEFAAGIPGTVGGSIYGNAGAYNACIMDYVQSVTVINENNEIKILEHEDISYGYRTSMFKEEKKYIIVGAKFFLKAGDKKSSLEIIEDRRIRRAETQPLEYPSAGSVFRNPEDNFAGKLIEDIGLKGKRIGGAMVSDKHANFIINYDNATSKDIKDLIDLCHDSVLKEYNIDMKCEQEFVNWE